VGSAVSRQRRRSGLIAAISLGVVATLLTGCQQAASPANTTDALRSLGESGQSDEKASATCNAEFRGEWEPIATADSTSDEVSAIIQVLPKTDEYSLLGLPPGEAYLAICVFSLGDLYDHKLDYGAFWVVGNNGGRGMLAWW